MGKGDIMMLQVMATLQSTEKLVEETIEGLEKFKASGYKGQEPFTQLMLLIIKFQQGENADPWEVMQRAMRDEDVVEQAAKIHDATAAPEDRILPDDEEEKEIVLKKIYMGGHGEA